MIARKLAGKKYKACPDCVPIFGGVQGTNSNKSAI